MIAEIRNSAIATKKMIFAISIDSPAIPPNPSTAAISATTRNVRAQPSMVRSLLLCGASPRSTRQPRLKKIVPQSPLRNSPTLLALTQARVEPRGNHSGSGTQNHGSQEQQDESRYRRGAGSRQEAGDQSRS